jgi:hypothetical protein
MFSSNHDNYNSAKNNSCYSMKSYRTNHSLKDDLYSDLKVKAQTVSSLIIAELIHSDKASLRPIIDAVRL